MSYDAWLNGLDWIDGRKPEAGWTYPLQRIKIDNTYYPVKQKVDKKALIEDIKELIMGHNKGYRRAEMSQNYFSNYFKLESGMIIITNNGHKWVVVRNASTGQYFAINSYGNHLGNIQSGFVNESNTGKALDYKVKEVWRVRTPYPNNDLTETGSEKVWSYSEHLQRIAPVKEVTLAEVAEKFGIAVEKLRIKEDDNR